MLEQNRIQRGSSLRIQCLEGGAYSGRHRALLVRQWTEQGHEGRTVDIYRGQGIADVVAVSFLMLCLQAHSQHLEKLYDSRGGGRAGFGRVAVLPTQVLRDRFGKAAGMLQ